MIRFTRLFTELDRTTRTGEKVNALVRYFRETPTADAAWALQFLTGQRLKRLINTKRLREWTAAEADLPLWIIEESYDAVGDLAETMALILPQEGVTNDTPLHELIEHRLLPLRSLDEEAKRALVVRTWRELDRTQRLVWNKMMTGAFRIGVARTLVIRAMAQAAGVSTAVMTHRMMGPWRADAARYEAVMRSEITRHDPAQPYPFFLAHQLGEPLESLGEPGAWRAEWKWDGIRGQLIRRGGRTMIWTRGEELVTERYPEVIAAADDLPDGTVLDGELLAWEDKRPLPFALLQRRIGRKEVQPGLFPEVPVVFMAYDLLEQNRDDLRRLSLHERSRRLKSVIEANIVDPGIRLSPEIAFTDWSQLMERHAEARERQVEGIMLKRRDSTYGVGRQRGPWWKWKVDPLTIDAVLTAAQRGHGRRAMLYTDFTFALRSGNDELVTIAKASSGLTDREFREVDAFIRQHTVSRQGPIRIIEPRLVFELGFEGVQESSRHKSGLAVRFPRMLRWRKDKTPGDINHLDDLRAMLPRELRL
ncbi:MAG: ATP-dependent DNA ligase [Phycisphaerales bacterium]|nr:MAG: ATP-dependent DNA ligase [Phycisphaerales bacterium]